jgi:hypothetical protein
MNELGLSAGRRVSVEAVAALIASVQMLVDASPRSEDRLARYVTGAYVGDLQAIGALAMIAARPADPDRN